MGTPMIAYRTDCYHSVLEEFSHEKLWELLNAPRSIDYQTLTHVINWSRPLIVKGNTFVDVVLDSGLLKTRSEISRKVKEGGMKWNGQRVTNMNMPTTFLNPGWGVIQLGKKTHKVVLDCNWEYE